jgi:uncharacterized spore protein YtfJ
MLRGAEMNKLIIAFMLIGIIALVGCTTGNASYDPPSGPIGGGCGVGASIDDSSDPCSDIDIEDSVAL